MKLRTRLTLTSLETRDNPDGGGVIPPPYTPPGGPTGPAAPAPIPPVPPVYLPPGGIPGGGYTPPG